MSETNDAPHALTEKAHPRTFRANRFVYPVLSRRSGGVSVGINLNVDKACNFDCIYCQVDRGKTPSETFIDLPALVKELREVLTGLQPNGHWWKEPEFASIPADKATVRDVGFSGDGEPTTFRNFNEVVQAAVKVKEELGFLDAKVVILTNATGLNRPDVREALSFLDEHQGEIWAKLDAGTEAYFRLVDGTRFPFDRILENILDCARARSIVIQSCFMRINGAGPSEEEMNAYLGHLKNILAEGGRIHLVQVHTIARDPAYGVVSSLSREEVDHIASRVRAEIGIQTGCFYGNVPEGRGLMGHTPPELS